MGGITHSGLDFPTSIVNQEDTPDTCLQANLMGMLPQFWYPLPR